MTNIFPTGTVTFLFTDIEGSTALWERYPEAMKPVLARHDAILRQAVEDNQGHIVKTTGDGCHAAFETAVSAIQATLAAQQALNAEQWGEIQPQALRVRMGVHTGEAEARGGDYYGPVLNRAARLMSVGYGGQVLVSATTAELLRDILPAETTLLDLGEHRLKDLVRPEHVFQLTHPALPSGFPSLKSLDAYPNNLPVQLTSFIGREREIEEAKRLLSTTRLVTFTGSGGTGKTRLAQQVAAELLTSFADGVWLVELAPLADPNLILPALAGVFDLRDLPGSSLIDLVTSYLRGKQVLLILDNCEHLIDACAQLADHLLHNCSRLKILASSREGLGITGEISYRVPSLSLPSLNCLTPEELLASESARLFLERGTAVNPRFTLSEKETPAVAQICRRLDGIPLALELAAARIKLFSAEQIATRLNDRLRLLTGGSRTALPRQQTLRAMIDWSYDLLTEPERALLRQLSVFVGGWSYEAAEAVCPELDVLTLLDQLVNKSLVGMEENLGQARYYMLETIRQYAQEKLIEAGEAITLRERHLDYFLRLSAEAEPGLIGNQAFEWIDRLRLDYDNLRAAIEWGRDGRPEDVLILIGNVTFFWGYGADDSSQAKRWLIDLLARLERLPADSGDPRRRLRARARGGIATGVLVLSQGDTPAAIDAIRTAIALERELGKGFWLAFALGLYGTMMVMSGDIPSARQAAEESLSLREVYDRRWSLLSLPILLGVEHQSGNHEKAEQLHLEIRQALDRIDHPMFLPSLLGLGLEARYRGRLEEARSYIDEGYKIAQRLKSRHFMASMESELAHIALESGDVQEAMQAYQRLIYTWKDIGQFAAVANILEIFASIACNQGEIGRAARLFGAAEATREEIKVPMMSEERKIYENTVSALRTKMDPSAFLAAWMEGRAMDLEHAISCAVSLPDG